MPTQVVKILGYMYDTRDLTVYLPDGKVTEYSDLIMKALDRRSIKREKFESLLGKLNDAAKIVWPGRALLKYAYSLLPAIRRPSHHIPLNRRVKHDLRIFYDFLHSIKKVPLNYIIRSTSDFDFTVMTDASKEGLGFALPPYWSFIRLPTHLSEYDIDLLEALALVSAAKSLAHILCGKRVLCGFFLSLGDN